MTQWHIPRTWSNFELVVARYLNDALLDNMAFLKRRPYSFYVMPAIIDTTSTSFVPVTGATTNVTTVGGNVFIAVCGIFSNSAAGASGTFDVAVDGVRVGDATTGLGAITTPLSNYPDCMSIPYLSTSAPAAGSHTIAPHWKVSSNTGSTLLRFFVIELR